MDINDAGKDVMLNHLKDSITKVIVFNGTADITLPIYKKDIISGDLKLYAYLSEVYVGTFSNFRFATEEGVVLLYKEVTAADDAVTKNGSAGYLKAFSVSITNIN